MTEPNNLDEAGWKAKLAAGAAELSVPLDDTQADKLWRLGLLLRERNEQVNLTSIVSPEGILTLHMLDSLSIVPDMLAAKTVLDVGTGGGFPGLPLAVACPEREFMLIDGTQKKIRFVHAHRRHAEEDPVRERGHRAARDHEREGRRRAR
jgi:16S rRNA (guanine527-N7)-methyltransferase